MTNNQQLLRKFAPVVYLHSDETYLPSSVDWYLERTMLLDGNGNIVLNPVGNSQSLVNANADSSYHLKLINDSGRTGTGVDAPVYGTVRSIQQADLLVGYDLTYWFFYPFNGNIFDKTLAIGVLSGLLAGAIFTVLNPLTWPAGITGTAALSAAIDYLRTVDGIQMHEGDWEHITVRINLSEQIVGVYYAAHDGGEWYEEPASAGSSGRDGYTLIDETHPVGYSAKASHASYAWSGTKHRLAHIADDHMDQGAKWDTRDLVIDIGHNVADPLNGQLWLKYPGRWGKPGTQPAQGIDFFGLPLGEFANGPTGPGQKASWNNGDSSPPDVWPRNAQFIVPTTGNFAITGFQDFLVLVNQEPDASPHHFTYVLNTYQNGTWSQHPIPMPFLNGNLGLTLAAFQNNLHVFYASINSSTLGWSVLVIDESGQGFKSEWQQKAFPYPFDPSNTGLPTSTVLGAQLFLASSIIGGVTERIRFFKYDGNSWTNLTGTIPRDWVAYDGSNMSLATYRENVYLAWMGAPLQKMNIARFHPNSSQWELITPRQPFRNPNNDSRRFSLSSFADYLYLVYVAHNSSAMYWSRYSDETGWRSQEGDFRIVSQPCSGYLALVGRDRTHSRTVSSHPPRCDRTCDFHRIRPPPIGLTAPFAFYWHWQGFPSLYIQ